MIVLKRLWLQSTINFLWKAKQDGGVFLFREIAFLRNNNSRLRVRTENRVINVLVTILSVPRISKDWYCTRIRYNKMPLSIGHFCLLFLRVVSRTTKKEQVGAVNFVREIEYQK